MSRGHSRRVPITSSLADRSGRQLTPSTRPNPFNGGSRPCFRPANEGAPVGPRGPRWVRCGVERRVLTGGRPAAIIYFPALAPAFRGADAAPYAAPPCPADPGGGEAHRTL